MAKDRPRTETNWSHHWLIVSLVVGMACIGAFRDDIARSHRSPRATRGVRLDFDQTHSHGDGSIDFGYSYDEPLEIAPASLVLVPPAFYSYISYENEPTSRPDPQTSAYQGRAPPSSC